MKSLNKILDSSPLAYLMVIEAVQRFSAEVAASKVEDYPPRGFVEPLAWVETAQKIQHILNK
jgi:hypothetical protein